MKKYKLLTTIIIILLSIFIFTSCSFLGFIQNKLNPLNNAKYSDKMLYLSVKDSNLEGVKEAVAAGANLNETAAAQDGTKNPIRILLYLHSKFPDKITQYLLDHGANPNYTDDTGVSLLMYSAYHTDLETCKLLLDHGVDVNQIGNDKQDYRSGKINYIAHNGYTALDYALVGQGSAKDIESIIDLLLKHGAKLDSQTVKASLEGYSNDGYCRYDLVQWILKELKKEGKPSGLDPIVETSILGDNEKVKGLINTNKLSKENELQVLFNTAAFGSIENLNLLLTKGLDINALDADHNNLLIAAAENGNLSMVNYLLGKRININQMNNDYVTALNKAVENNHYSTAEYLLKKGASLELQDGQDPFKDPFNCAILNKDIKMMQLILSFGYQKNSHLNVIAENAVLQGNPDILDFALADNKVTDEVYNNALSFACLYNKVNIAEHLLNKGVDVNGGKGEKMGDPLLTASEIGTSEIVNLLIKKGADVNIYAQSKDSALNFAIIYGNMDIVKLLVENGADINTAHYKSNETPLLIAARSTSQNVLKYLIEKGANINAINSEGFTALMYSATKGYNENAKILLDNKADTKIKNNMGQTALNLADQNGNNDVVDLLKNR